MRKEISKLNFHQVGIVDIHIRVDHRVSSLDTCCIILLGLLFFLAKSMKSSNLNLPNDDAIVEQSYQFIEGGSLSDGEYELSVDCIFGVIFVYLTQLDGSDRIIYIYIKFD